MSTYEHKLAGVANGHGYYDAIGREADAEVAALKKRVKKLLGLLGLARDDVACAAEMYAHTLGDEDAIADYMELIGDIDEELKQGNQ